MQKLTLKDIDLISGADYCQCETSYGDFIDPNEIIGSKNRCAQWCCKETNGGTEWYWFTSTTITHPKPSYDSMSYTRSSLAQSSLPTANGKCRNYKECCGFIFL